MRLKSVAIIISLITIIIAGVFLYWDSTHLSVRKSPPKEIGSTEAVRITFNHDLDPTTARNFSLKPYTQGSIEIKNNELIFTPNQGFTINTNYTYELKNPRSKNGLIGNTVKGQFLAVYKDFSQTNKQDQEQQIESSNSFEKKYPITQYLPHETSHYNINYQLVEGSDKLFIIITTLAILNRESQLSQFKQNTLDYRQEARDYITSKGFKLEDFNIKYSPNTADGSPEK